LHKQLGTNLVQSSTYHPQMSRQTERVNQILEDMLRACVISSKGSWENWLPLAEFSYNNSLQESIKMVLSKPCMVRNVELLRTRLNSRRGGTTLLILSRKLKSKFVSSNNTLKSLSLDKRAMLTKEEDLLSLR
jgi:hypothetical protein